MIGKTLGHYEITAKLGEGGMGEVYRAHDARLGRDVAVKVLPVRLSSNEEIRARFEREAKTISSLNHPHICVLYDVGREDDVDYLVMELIEGETLADRLSRGLLTTKEVLKIGGQIADALDRAHREGVVHRDLKPGNVMITRAGAKLMDFGLARATGLAGPSAGTTDATIANLSQSPTIAQPLTTEGTILGTFQYMAPEQLEGHEADERSDLWALGCVLYEMATGRRAFEGASQASLIASIMQNEPQPVSQIAALAPPELDRLVSACLAKDPADRVQSAHDVKLQLSWMGDGATTISGVAPPAMSSVKKKPNWISYAGIALAAAAAAALVTAFLLRDGADQPITGDAQRYILSLANPQSTSTPLISPDGTYVLVALREGDSNRIYRRSLDRFEMKPIAGTEDGKAPFFSPDGAWLGFVTEDAIMKVPVDGGVAQVVVSYPRPDAGDWGDDGMIYFCPRNGGQDGTTALARVPESGGTVEILAHLDPENGETEAWLPEILPGGQTILISVFGSSGSRVIAAALGGSRRALIENAFLARYVRSGHIVYQDMLSEAVLAAPFDPVKVEITGPAVPLTQEVDMNHCFDVSQDGKLVYVPVPGGGEGGNQLVWIDKSGVRQPAADMLANWTEPRVSPDGNRVLVRRSDTNCELWMLDVERGSLSRIVQTDDNHGPIWGPDGRRIAFERQNSSEMVILTVQGSRNLTVLAKGPGHGIPQSWSADRLVYTVMGAGTRSDIWVRGVDDATPPVAFAATEFNESNPRISPDGKWIVFQSDEAGTRQIFLRTYPDSESVWQLSTEGGTDPIWSRDGREIYFASGRKMMAVSITTEPSPTISMPRLLFEAGVGSSAIRDFDMAPDGRFIAAVSPDGESRGRELRVLLNWPRELDRLASRRH